jgi:hypothetical protein
LSIASIVSVVFLAITLCLSIASWWFDSWRYSEHKLSPSESFHIGLGRPIDVPFGCITFFSDERPYRGSIISLSTGEKPTYKRIWYLWIYGFSREIYTDKSDRETEVMNCCDLPGIYYRYFRTPDSTHWTLTISIWLPLLLFSLLPCVQIWTWLKKRNLNSESRCNANKT